MESFSTHSVRLLGDEAQVEARFGLFVDNATLMQDWCMVCVERTVGSKIVLKAPNGTPRMGHVESRFDMFYDTISVGAR
jgi:hypothetical protein